MCSCSATTTRLHTADMAALSDAEVSTALLERLAERDALTAEIRTLAGEWDKRLLWAMDGARSGPAWLAANTELSRGRAAAELQVAKRLRTMPHVAAASESGRLGAEKIAALTHAVDRDPTGSKAELFADAEHDLVDDAEHLTVEETRRAVSYWRSCADDATAAEDTKHQEDLEGVQLGRTFAGMWDLKGLLTGLDGETLNNRLNERIDQLRRAERATLADGEVGASRAQLRAQALMDLLGRAPGSSNDEGEDPNRPLPLFIIDVPLETVEDRTAKPATTPDGTPLAPETLRRLACEAGIAMVITCGGHAVLDLGRASYTPNRAQRRALAKRDGHCAFPGCDAPVAYCDAHHLWHWEDGGPTALWNLALLCRFHHHTVHEGHFRLVADEKGWLHAYRPDGTPIPWPHGQAPHRITPRPRDAEPPPNTWPYDKPPDWPPGAEPPRPRDDYDELAERRRLETITRQRLADLTKRRTA